jgi:inosine/xanthosine triphosphate pyrophosphatase family protein
MSSMSCDITQAWSSTRGTACPAHSSPGPRHCRPQGILALAAGLTNCRATVTTALGYATVDGVSVLQGTVNGSLATEPRGTSGFGCDSIFISDSDTSQRTYAQRSSEKRTRSPTGGAVEEMRSALGLA